MQDGNGCNMVGQPPERGLPEPGMIQQHEVTISKCARESSRVARPAERPLRVQELRANIQLRQTPPPGAGMIRRDHEDIVPAGSKRATEAQQEGFDPPHLEEWHDDRDLHRISR